MTTGVFPLNNTFSLCKRTVASRISNFPASLRSSPLLSFRLLPLFTPSSLLVFKRGSSLLVCHCQTSPWGWCLAVLSAHG